MARTKDLETFKRDNLLVDFIKKHKGSENAVSGSAVCDFLNENGYKIKSRSINNLVSKIKFARNLPICYKRCAGFFWANTREDIETTIRDLQLMIFSLQEHVRFLENFIIKK